MNLITFWLILLGVLLNAVAQLFLKAGTNVIGDLFISRHRLLKSLVEILFEPHILSGLFCYLVSVAIWIVALSRVPVSIAYPMLSIGYVVNLFAASYLFGESITVQKMFAIGLIISGVYTLAKS